MRYLSVCSGIEAATVAWHPLGWEPAAFAEIEAFPSTVLAHHYPDTPNLGDMTTIDHERLGPIDLLVGGTPCQSFSVAGLRKGMDDARGNLALEFVRLALSTRPRWIVWENVPGVLSSNEGRDFGSFLGALGECGYGFAHRVLDAQYFGLAQRRKRVFVVGHLGDWRPAAAVLLERESMCGHPPPSRAAREGATGSVESGAFYAGQGAAAGSIAWTPEGSPTLKSTDSGTNRTPTVLKIRAGCEGGGKGAPVGEEQSFTLATAQDQVLFVNNRQDPVHDEELAQPLGAKDNGGAICFDTTQVTSPGNYSSPKEGDPSHPLAAGAHPPALCFAQNTRDEVRLQGGDGEIAGALAAEAGMKQTNYVKPGSVVRRLTPIECERLQGFPDNYTRIAWKGKAPEDCPDGPRYKALGNSMAVPVMRWIGERIQQVEEILS